MKRSLGRRIAWAVGALLVGVGLIMPTAFADDAADNQKAQDIAVNYLKGATSEQDAANAGIDAAIGIVELGFPEAAPALALLKGFFSSGQTSVLDNRMQEAEHNIQTLNDNLGTLRREVDKEKNLKRIQLIQIRESLIRSYQRKLPSMPTMSATDKRAFVGDVLDLADQFIPRDESDLSRVSAGDDDAKLDYWQWNDVLVKSNKNTGKVDVMTETQPRFELNLQAVDYLRTLAVLVAAINGTGENIPAAAKRTHIAFLTVNPDGPNGQPVNWTTPLLERKQPVLCSSAGSKYPDANLSCSVTLTCRGATTKQQTYDFKVAERNQLCTYTPFAVDDERDQLMAEVASGARGEVAQAFAAAADALGKAGKVEPKFDPVTYGGGALIFAVNPQGELLEFEDARSERANGTPHPTITHKFNFIRKIDDGWNQYTQVASTAINDTDLAVFATIPNGDLMQIGIKNYRRGPTSVVKNPTRIGNGWTGTTIFSPGEGVLYGVKPNGDLQWYRHKAPLAFPGGYNWRPDNRIGWGWGGTRHLFSTGNGVIYAVKDNYDLYWYRHLSYETGEGLSQGAGHWAEPPRKVGNGWNCNLLTAGEEGAIYCVKPNGELWGYRHLGWQTGENKWEEPYVKLGDGFANYLALFSEPGIAEDLGVH